MATRAERRGSPRDSSWHSAGSRSRISAGNSCSRGSSPSLPSNWNATNAWFEPDKLATMGALATGIAHEVSTPLAVIVGRAEQLLGKSTVDDRSKRAVEAILEQASASAYRARVSALARGEVPTMHRVDPKTLGVAAVNLVQHRFVQSRGSPDERFLRCGAAGRLRTAADGASFGQLAAQRL